jgi:hypothetical protein
MIYTTKFNARQNTGISYIGKINNGAKHCKAYNYNELVYTIYLAPANISGYEVCPGRSPECTKLCLNESGQNRMDIHENRINKIRIKKTKLFFEDREFFVRWVIAEIITAKNHADRIGYKFSVRLNNTSDISPEEFYVIENGEKKNLLEIFPDIQFYDYSKMINRKDLVKKYKNYDLTFSYNGFNKEKCIEMLKNKIRVAVVFKNKKPDMFWNYKVIDGDLKDMQYQLPNDVIVGLKYKITRIKFPEKSKFVVEI